VLQFLTHFTRYFRVATFGSTPLLHHKAFEAVLLVTTLTRTKYGEMESAKRSKASAQAKVKSEKARGKERAESVGSSKLKSGWALVPLVLNASDNSVVNKKRARSPVKKDSPIAQSQSKKKPKTSLSKRVSNAAIEILSDSDEDEDDEIQEISVRAIASTSKTILQSNIVKPSKILSAKVKAEVVELDLAVKEHSHKARTPAKTVPKLEIHETFDLDDDDDEEQENAMVRSIGHAKGKQRETFADENEILEEVDDDWGDAERIWQASRSNSLDAGAYEEDEDYDSFNTSGRPEQSGDSDEDILEVKWICCHARICHHFSDSLASYVHSLWKMKKNHLQFERKVYAFLRFQMQSLLQRVYSSHCLRYAEAYLQHQACTKSLATPDQMRLLL
jgi:hypothetical protein